MFKLNDKSFSRLVVIASLVIIFMMAVATLSNARPTDGLPIFVNGHQPALNQTNLNNIVISINDLGVNVMNYGAVPDDTGDDTAAIQKALDAAGSGVVIAPNGTYRVSGNIHLHANQTLKGSGWNTIFFVTSQGDWNLFDGGTPVTQNWVIRDLAINLNHDNTANPSSHIYGAGVSISYAHASIINCHIYGGHQRLIQGYSCNNAIIQDNLLEDWANDDANAALDIDYGDYTTGDTVSAGASRYCIITGNTIKGNMGGMYNGGIEIDGTSGIGRNCIVSDNIVQDCYMGIKLSGNTQGMIVNGNVINDGSYPIYVMGYGSIISDNIIGGYGDAGITIEGAYNDIHDNIITNRISTAPIWIKGNNSHIWHNSLYGGNKGILIDGDNNTIEYNGVYRPDSCYELTINGDYNKICYNSLIPGKTSFRATLTSGEAAGSYRLLLNTTVDLYPGSYIRVVEGGKSTLYTRTKYVGKTYIIMNDPVPAGDYTTSAVVVVTGTTDPTGILINSGADYNEIKYNTIATGSPITNSGTGNVIKGNTGYLTENYGTATVINTATNVDVTHGLSRAPDISHIIVTPTNNLGNAAKYWISDVGATTFRINVDADPGAGTATFVWSII